jgi:hypothetical protein
MNQLILPNELRVGNVLMCIKDKKPMHFIIDAEDILHCEKDTKAFSKRYKRVPLTPKILLEIGFQQRYSPRSREFHLHDRMIIFDENGAFDYAARTRLPYLHTLQNFIYFVEGIELTINLK